MNCKVLLSVCSTVSFWCLASAFPLYQQRIPNGGNVPGNPGLGHVLDSGSGSLNGFGNLFQTEGYEWTQTLCEADSDGDLYSNGFELGDPDCTWTQGEADPEGPLSDPTKASSLPVVPTVPPTDSPQAAQRWSVLEEDLVCQVLVVGAGLAGMTAASVASSLGHEVCVLSSSPPNASTSAASSGTLYLPLQGPFPDQVSPLEFYAQERKDRFLEQVASAAQHLEEATGASLEPVLDPYPTYFDVLTDRVVVLVDPGEDSSSSSSGSGTSVDWKCGGQLPMTETLSRLERAEVLYRTGRVESLAYMPNAPSPSGRYVVNTTEGHHISAYQVILASGGYGASRTDLPWKGALAGNDGLNLRVAQSVGTPTTKEEEGWFVEKGEQQVRWFLWEENATVVDQQYQTVPGYEPTDAYDVRGRQRLAANKTDEDLWLLSSATDFCSTSPVVVLPEPLGAANGSSLQSISCGPSADLWYNFLECFGCPEKQVPCGSRLAEGTQECRRDRLELWVIDSNGGPVVDDCNQFEGREGLFAAGNAAPPMLGHAYLAPGSTLGNALVSAHVAASCLVPFPGSSEGGTLDSESSGVKWPVWLVTHTVGMAFAWGYFFVLGHSQMLGRKKPRTNRHRWLQITAVVLALLAGLSVVAGGSSSVVWKEYGVHPVLGLIAFVLVFTQLLLIALKKGVQHRYLGRALPFVLLLALLSGLWVGLDLYSMPPAIFLLVFPAILTLLLWSGHVALFLAF